MSKRHFEKKFKKTISSALAVSIVLGSINIGAVGDSLKGTQENKIVSSAESKLNSLKKIVINNPKKAAGIGLLGLTGIGGLGFILSKLFGKNNSNKNKGTEGKNGYKGVDNNEGDTKKEEKDLESEKPSIENIDCLFDPNFQAPDGSTDTWEKRAKEVFGSVDGNELGNKKCAEKFGINETQLIKVAKGEYNILDLFTKLEDYYLHSGNDNDRIFNPQRRALLFAICELTHDKKIADKCWEINNKLNEKALLNFLKTYSATAKLLAKMFLLFQIGETKFTKRGSSQEFKDSNIEIFKAIAQGESVVVKLPGKFAKDNKYDILQKLNDNNNNPEDITEINSRSSTHDIYEIPREDGTTYLCEKKSYLSGATSYLGIGEVKNRSVGVNICKYNNSNEKNELLVVTSGDAALFKLEPIAPNETSVYGHKHGLGGKSNNITPTGQFRAWSQFSQRKAMISDLSGCKMEVFNEIYNAFSKKLDDRNVDFEKLIGEQLTVGELSKLIGYDNIGELKNCRDHLTPYKSFGNFKELKCCDESGNGNYSICIKYCHNRYRTITVGSDGTIITVGQFENKGYTNGCLTLSEQYKRAISIDALTNENGEFCEKILEAIGTKEIPGVKIFRSERDYLGASVTIYGYIIEDIKKFLDWCNIKNIEHRDRATILLCQNLWFYTSGRIESWQISKLPTIFAQELNDIKENNSASENKQSEYVVPMPKVEDSSEWRIHKYGSEEFTNISDALKENMEDLDVNGWVELFKNSDPTKGSEEFIKGVLPEKFASKFINK